MNGKKVFVFDDEKDILFMCRLILEAKGFEVGTSEHVRSVVDDITAFEPDLVLMDNLIPDIGGVAATQQIKTSFAALPVILFTASKDIELLAENAGSDAFIAKPFDIDDMTSLIKKLLSGDNSNN